MCCNINISKMYKIRIIFHFNNYNIYNTFYINLSLIIIYKIRQYKLELRIYTQFGCDFVAYNINIKFSLLSLFFFSSFII